MLERIFSAIIDARWWYVSLIQIKWFRVNIFSWATNGCLIPTKNLSSWLMCLNLSLLSLFRNCLLVKSGMHTSWVVSFWSTSTTVIYTFAFDDFPWLLIYCWLIGSITLNLLFILIFPSLIGNWLLLLRENSWLVTLWVGDTTSFWKERIICIVIICQELRLRLIGHILRLNT